MRGQGQDSGRDYTTCNATILIGASARHRKLLRETPEGGSWGKLLMRLLLGVLRKPPVWSTWCRAQAARPFGNRIWLSTCPTQVDRRYPGCVTRAAQKPPAPPKPAPSTALWPEPPWHEAGSRPEAAPPHARPLLPRAQGRSAHGRATVRQAAPRPKAATCAGLRPGPRPCRLPASLMGGGSPRSALPRRASWPRSARRRYQLAVEEW